MKPDLMLISYTKFNKKVVNNDLLSGLTVEPLQGSFSMTQHTGCVLASLQKPYEHHQHSVRSGLTIEPLRVSFSMTQRTQCVLALSNNSQSLSAPCKIRGPTRCINAGSIK